MGVVFIYAGGQFVVTIYKGKGVHGTPREDINFGSSTLSSMALERKSSIQLNRSRVRGVESVVCYVPYPTIQSPIFFMFHVFRSGSKKLGLAACV